MGAITIQWHFINSHYNICLLLLKIILFPFLPCNVCKVEEALKHPFLSSLHEINEEPTCQSPFKFDFEQTSLSEEDVKELIWTEALRFNPDKMFE